jgi:hypothetical protein
MSYDIYFVRKADLTIDEFNTILETDEVNESDELFIHQNLKESIQETIKREGLAFETFAGEDGYLELTFPTFQLSMFNNQIGISLPYWDENSTDETHKDVQLIINTLLEKGFTGFDPQTEEFITRTHDIGKKFTEVKTIVDQRVVQETRSSNSVILYLGLGLGILILGLIIWKLVK